MLARVSKPFRRVPRGFAGVEPAETVGDELSSMASTWPKPRVLSFNPEVRTIGNAQIGDAMRPVASEKLE